MTIEGKDQRATEPDELTASDLELAKHLDGFVDDYSRGKLSTLREFLLEHPETPSELLKDLETFSTVSSIVSDKTVPSRFGDFEILRELGRGGMGIVYEARQVALDRKVALKVLPANLLSDPRAVVRFNREAIVAASLHHPNIVGVYAMGVDAGTPYFAMEFARGDTLEQILRRIGLRDERIREEVGGTTERLLKLVTILQLRKRAAGEGALVSPARLESAHGLPGSAQETAEGRLKDSYFVGIAEAFAAVADGLQHAHDHGIIHRDLKPSNLILDSDGCLRILDFGVARVANLPHLTLLEERIGTPLYMSPEQAQAPPGPLGPGTDVYSLGATLYEMLVFRPPLQGKDTQDTLDKIVHEDPSPPRKWNRVIPRDLETIVLKCLRKDPRQRYGTAEALAQDLRRFVRGEPIEARPQPLHVIFARRAWHARRTVFQTAGLVLALVAVGLFLINILVKAHERQVQLYEERVRQGVRSMLNKQLLWPRDQLITVKGEKILQSERRRDVPIQSRETDGSSRLIVASSLIVAGPALGDVGPDPLEEAVGFFKEAIDRFPSKPFAHFHLARALLLQGRLRQAKREIEITLKLKPGFLPALSLLASILERAGDAAKAEAARAEVARRAPPEKDGWESAWMEAQQALLEQRWRDAAEAFDKLSSPKRQKEPYLAYDVETLLGRGVARLRAGKWYRDLALADFGAAAYRWADWLEPVLFQGRVLHSSGRIDAARQLFKRCFEKALEAQPGSKDEVAGAILSAYMEAGDWNEALSWADAMSDGYVKYLSNAELLNQRGDYERALAHAWDALSLRDDVATNIVLGNNHMARGDLESASLFYEAARQTAEEDPRPLVALGICREAQGYITDAENLFLGATLLDGAPGLAYYNLGRVLDTQGRYEEAVQAYENALSQDPGNALAHNNLAVLLDRQGKRYEARSHYFRAVELAHRFAGAHYNLGWALHRECRYAEAYREYREALELGLDDAILRGNLAATLQLGLGFEGEAYLDGAIQQYRAAIRANPEYPTNHLDLGTALYYRRSWEEAAESYRNYMKLDPLDDGVHYNLGLVLQEQGLVEQAVSSYREGLKLNPRQVWGHNALANLLLREAAPVPAGKELTDAIVLLEDAVRLDGAEESVHILLEKYRRALGDKLPSYASIDAAVDAPLCLAPEQGRFRYLRARTQPSLEDEWTLPDFNDATWEEGSAPFGRPEGGDVSTVIQGVTGSDDSLFLRCTFDNPMGLTARGLTLCVRSSGGFVVYLNGRAVARRAAAEGAASDAVARQVKKAPWKAQEFPVDPADLHAGKNALAVQSLGLDREGEDFLMEVVLEARPVPAERKLQRAAERLEAFRAGMAGPGAATRLRYFEGRLLEMSGQMDGALQKFLSVIREDGSRPEPFIRAAECLRELGRLQEAERCLREALASGLSNHDFLWDAWLRLALVDLRSDPADVLKAFPARESEAAGKLTGHPADILWLLEQLAAGNAIRINCGGANYAQKEFTWSRDRFFRSGRRYYLFRLNALYDGVDDAALYQTERYFVDPVLADSEGFFPGYRIPLPPGNYRVRLHFTEGHFTAAGKRRFDVLLEGKPVLEDYEPWGAGFGVPDKPPFDLPVDDGALEIDFKRRIENPKISAIEIERI